MEMRAWSASFVGGMCIGILSLDVGTLHPPVTFASDWTPGYEVEKPFERRKDAYIDQIENLMRKYNREVAKLDRRSGGQALIEGSPFDKARRDYYEKARALREKLAEIASLSPQAARPRKPEIDAALKELTEAFSRVQSTVR